ncbi:MAG TPA: Fe-S cluster assembly protein SufD [Gammaproteobacteria bacterium]|nr:Fe-S cluster assembly protein SufD [Gammaproteobacteria bacterium]
MNELSEAIRPYAENFKAFEALHTNTTPAWLPALRRNAFARFAEHGFPTTRNENWKYTSTRLLEKRAFVSAPAMPIAITADDLKPLLMQETAAHTLVFVNGQYTPALSDKQFDVAGLHISDLDSALENTPAHIENTLAPESAWDGDLFTMLNTAFLKNGIVIELDDGMRLESPLQLVFVSTQQSQALACHPRILIRMGADTHAALVETWFGFGAAANFTNSYAQILLNKGAQLEHLRLQREGMEEFHVSRTDVVQRRGSRYLSHTLNLGGLWVRNDLRTRLEAPEAETRLNGLYLANGRQHVDNHTRIDHLAPNTRSDELYRGIINDRGHAVFNGKVVVAEHAVKTDAAQSNNNLLLSRQGEIDTKPELEIYADDVKCSHGATVGQLDEDALFYLRSRGLDAEQARSLLMGAFALAVLDRITVPALRKFARRQLADLIPQSAVMESS